MDDLASVWCEAAELELSHKNFRRALELMRRATTPPARSTSRRSKEEMEGPVQVGFRVCRVIHVRLRFMVTRSGSLGASCVGCLVICPCCDDGVRIPKG